jgi:hypothetical protein
MTSHLTGRRIGYTSRKLSWLERIKWKARHVARALRWSPPETVEDPVFLSPGDPGYEDAAMVEVFEMCGEPFVFDVK